METEVRKSSGRLEKAIIALCLIGLLLSSAWLFFGDKNGGSLSDSDRPVIGKVEFARNDTRHRGADALAWDHASENDEVRKGDALFSGKGSSSRVTLKDGSSVDLGENTLVHFNDVDGIEVPNLGLGNFRVHVNGSLKVAIQGEMTELSGSNSDVQIILDQNKKPKLRLISGTATVRPKGQSQVQLDRVVRDLNLPHRRAPEMPKELGVTRNVAEAPPMAVATPKPTPVPAPTPAPTPLQAKLEVLPNEQSVNYTYRLYDLYEQKSQDTLKKRSVWADRFAVPTALRWKGENLQGPVTLQLARADNFFPSISYDSGAGGLTLPFIYEGDNFWRVSFDKIQWQVGLPFKVTPRMLPEKPPIFSFSKHQLVILDKSVREVAVIATPNNYRGFVLEMSPDPEFPSDLTTVRWVAKKKLSFGFQDSGVFYYRIRAVNDANELTEVSTTERLNILKPTPVGVPKMAEQELHGTVNEPLKVGWSQVKEAKDYQVQVQDAKGKVIYDTKTKDTNFAWVPKKTGRYSVRVAAVDNFDRKGSQRETPATIAPKPMPIAKKEEQARKPASIESTSTMEMDKVPPDYLNKNYRSSIFEIEFATDAMESTDQKYNGDASPLEGSVALRGHQWWGNDGAEEFLKLKLLDMSGSSGGSSQQFEARYLHRWFMNWNLFSGYEESQLALIAGAEVYRNPGAADFSPGYNLLKVGGSLQFPLGKHWDTGGEVVYGYGLDASTKYEIAGHLHYFFDKNFSAGVGYRLYLFQAGSESSSPGPLPYREGYGEGFTVLRWHY